MCVYLTYVLSAHTTYVALRVAGACAFPSPGVCGTRGAEQGDVGDVPACSSLAARGITLTLLPDGIFSLHSAEMGPLSPQNTCEVVAPSCAPQVSESVGFWCEVL